MGFPFFSFHFSEKPHTVISDGRLWEKYLIFMISLSSYFTENSKIAEHKINHNIKNIYKIILI